MIRIKHGKGREDAQSFFDLCRLHVKSAGLDPDTTYFVYPVGGFGEFTFVCSLLPELRKKGKVAVFLPQARMYYHELFPNSGDFFLQYGPQFDSCLPDLFHFGMCHPGHPFVPFTDWLGDGRFNIELVAKEGRLTVKEGYAYIMGLPLSSAGLPPTIPAGAPPGGLDGYGKRVLLIPHANSHKPFQPAVWEMVAKRLEDVGYSVYFEVTSYPFALPIGTKSLSMKPSALLQSLAAFEAIVAIRSGLTDLIGAVPRAQRGKLAVLYHVTATPPTEEQRFCHAGGVTKSGLALTRIYPGDPTIRDFEINGDIFNAMELQEAIGFVLNASV